MCKQPNSVLTLHMRHSTQWNSNIQLEKWEEKLTWTKGGLWFYVCLVTCSSGPSVRKLQLSAPSLNSSNISIHSKLPAKVKAVTVWAAFVWVCQHFHALLKCDSRVWEEAVLQCWRGDYRLPTQSAGLTRALLLCQTFQREGRLSLQSCGTVPCLEIKLDQIGRECKLCSDLIEFFSLFKECGQKKINLLFRSLGLQEPCWNWDTFCRTTRIKTKCNCHHSFCQEKSQIQGYFYAVMLEKANFVECYVSFLSP